MELPDPARRHGRVLRLRDDPGPARAAGRPGHRGRRPPRGGAVGQLPARAYGVRSAMPMTRARRLCPHAVVRLARLRDVQRVSPSVMENFRQVTPLVEVVSLDEAFLDVSGAVRRLGSPLRRSPSSCARRSTTSRGSPARWGWPHRSRWPSWPAAGPSPTAWSWSRPTEITSFLHPLDVGSSGAWGRRPRSMLHRLGLVTVGDVAHTPLRTLQRASARRLGSQLHELAWGSDRAGGDRRAVAADEPDKSMGARRDVRPRHRRPGGGAARAAAALGEGRAAGCGPPRVAGRTVTLKVRFADFTTITRSRTLGEATDVTQEIYRDRGRPVHRARAAAGPDPAGRGPGRGAGARGPRCSASWCWGSGSAAGPRPTGRGPGDAAGSGSAAVRPATLLGSDRR